MFFVVKQINITKKKKDQSSSDPIFKHLYPFGN